MARQHFLPTRLWLDVVDTTVLSVTRPDCDCRKRDAAAGIMAPKSWLWMTRRKSSGWCSHLEQAGSRWRRATAGGADQARREAGPGRPGPRPARHRQAEVNASRRRKHAHHHAHRIDTRIRSSAWVEADDYMTSPSTRELVAVRPCCGGRQPLGAGGRRVRAGSCRPGRPCGALDGAARLTPTEFGC